MTALPLPEAVRNIRFREVAAALRDLEPGPYPVRDLYWRYIEACRAAGYAGGYVNAFGQALTMLGVPAKEYEPELGEVARRIDPAALAARFPHLPWSG